MSDDDLGCGFCEYGGWYKTCINCYRTMCEDCYMGVNLPFCVCPDCSTKLKEQLNMYVKQCSSCKKIFVGSHLKCNQCRKIQKQKSTT